MNDNNQQAARELCPWPDYAGSPIYSGDIIQHPDGQLGAVVFLPWIEYPNDAWRVVYDVGGELRLSRLCLQIDWKGKAVVIAPPRPTQESETHE